MNDTMTLAEFIDGAHAELHRIRTSFWTTGDDEILLIAMLEIALSYLENGR